MPTQSEEKVQALIRIHVQRYPEIDILDIYKLLHQAVFGPGHAIRSVRPAREWLEREVEILQPAPVEHPLVENIHPEQTMVRISLRPYIAAGGDLGRLFEAFVQSAKAVNGDLSTMAAWWKIFEGMTRTGGALAGRFDLRTITLLERNRAAENWPGMHHSPAFERAYKPAYRIITAKIARSMLDDQRIAWSMI